MPAVASIVFFKVIVVLCCFVCSQGPLTSYWKGSIITGSRLKSLVSHVLTPNLVHEVHIYLMTLILREYNQFYVRSLMYVIYSVAIATMASLLLAAILLFVHWISQHGHQVS